MDFRSTPCVFMGYSPLHHGYRCFDPVMECIYIICHVRFNEEVFPFHSPSPSLSNPNTSPIYVSTFPTHVASTPELYLEAPTTNEDDTPTPTSPTSLPPPPQPPSPPHALGLLTFAKTPRTKPLTVPLHTLPLYLPPLLPNPLCFLLPTSFQNGVKQCLMNSKHFKKNGT